MASKINLPPGERYGRWTVIEDAPSNKHGMAMSLCQCDCGREYPVIQANLRVGVSRQCRACGKGQVSLTVAQTRAIRDRYKREGYSHGFWAKLGRLYGVSPHAIKRIVADGR